MADGWSITCSPKSASLLNRFEVFLIFSAPISSASERGTGRSRFLVALATTFDSFWFFLICLTLNGETQGVELEYPLIYLCLSSLSWGTPANLPVSCDFIISFTEFSASTFWEVWSEARWASLWWILAPPAPMLPSANRGSIGIITSSNSSPILWWCKGIGYFYSDCSSWICISSGAPTSGEKIDGVLDSYRAGYYSAISSTSEGALKEGAFSGYF